MIRHWTITTTAAVVFIAAIWLSASGQSPSGQHDNRIKTAHNSAPSPESRGERVFKQNCSRCHNPPQGLPQQVSGTVIRHMRVRASLSAADEKALLEFMNP